MFEQTTTTATNDAGQDFDKAIGLSGPAKQKEIDALLKKNGVTREQVGGAAEIKLACVNAGCEWKGAAGRVDEFTEKPDRHGRFCRKCDKPVYPVSGQSNGNGDFKSEISNLKEEASTEARVPAAEYIPMFPGDPGPDWADALGAEYKITRDEVDDLTGQFPAFPAAIVRKVITEHNQITKRDVESVLAEFSMSLSLGDWEAEAMSLVVTKPNDTTMKRRCREHRMVGKKFRVAFDAMGFEIGEPLLRRKQIVDGIRREVKNRVKFAESHLQLQEDFDKLLEEKAQAELQAARIENLRPYEYEPTVEQINDVTFGKMTDAEWSAFRESVEMAYIAKQAEEEAAERARTRVLDRAIVLADLGFRVDGERYVYEGIRVGTSRMREETDEEWQRTLDYLTPQVTAIREEKEKARAATERFSLRTGSLTGIGLRCDGERFSFGDGILSYPVEFVRDATDDTFRDIVTAASAKIMEVKAEEKRVADEKAQAIADLEAKATAAREESVKPDKDKALAYIAGVYAATQNMPKVKSKKIGQMLETYFDLVANATNNLQKEIANLPG